MPRSNRHQVLTTLASIAFVVVIAAAVTSIWSQYQRGSNDYQEYLQRTYSDEQKAAGEIASKCNIAAAPTSIISECLEAEIHAYQERDTPNKDLQAQQDMAYWGLWMFVASAGGLAISTFGLILLFVSLRQTRTAIKDTRELGEAQVRAHLYCIAAKYERKKDMISAIIELGNAGNSPASNVKVEGDVGVQEVGGFAHMSRVLGWVNSGKSETYFQPIVASGTISDCITFFWGLDFIPNLDDDDDEKLKRAVFEGGNAVWFDLIVSWVDVFGKIHEFPLTLDGIIGPHPLKPNKKRPRTAALEIRMDDARTRPSAVTEQQET